jgi:hypothetical protein
MNQKNTILIQFADAYDLQRFKEYEAQVKTQDETVGGLWPWVICSVIKRATLLELSDDLADKDRQIGLLREALKTADRTGPPVRQLDAIGTDGCKVTFETVKAATKHGQNLVASRYDRLTGLDLVRALRLSQHHPDYRKAADNLEAALQAAGGCDGR